MPLSPESLFELLAPRVLVVECYEDAGKQPLSFGSGVVTASGSVVTNKHVVQRGNFFRAKSRSQAWACKLAYLHPDHDLCQLSVENLTAPPVSLRHSPEVVVGERVYAIGAPQGLDLTLSEGLVSGLRTQSGESVIQTTAAISEGSSGGGLFDGDGKLVGITTSFIKNGQNLNFALPAKLILGLVHHPVTERLRSPRERAATAVVDPPAIVPLPSLADFTGQQVIVTQLTIALKASQARGEALEHILMYGSPGLGKSILAHIIAREIGVQIHAVAGPTLSNPESLLGIFMNVGKNDVLFIDEIHRIRMPVEEMLYSAMEDYKLDVVLDKGQFAQPVTFPVNRFTLIGATTRMGDLSSPLRMRFGLVYQFEVYPVNELVNIVIRSAVKLTVGCDNEAAQMIARRSRGTPRIANNLLLRCRDLAQVMGKDHITAEIAGQALALEGVDEHGLTKLDYRYLQALIRNGGLAGVNALAANINETAATIVDVIEPYLLAKVSSPSRKLAARQTMRPTICWASRSQKRAINGSNYSVRMTGRRTFLQAT
jgi:holliday junction DNA helicase RuvB